MLESSTGNFSVPDDFIGKEVVIRLAIPIMERGLSFPEMKAVLQESLEGALLLRHGDGESIVLPKSRVWSVSLRSEIAVSSGIIKPY
jgi:hypothetical protein